MQTNNYFNHISFTASVKCKRTASCKVEYYSPEQRLSHQWVTTMLKDREGFMGFGSWDGINRFDGHAIVSYKSSPADSSQLKNDRIDQIVEDQADHLWIQAYDKLVYRFDKKAARFPSQPILKTQSIRLLHLINYTDEFIMVKASPNITETPLFIEALFIITTTKYIM